jgi:hypothetical protein
MTDYNVTVGYRPTLGVTQQASGIVGPAGSSYWTLTSAGIHTLSNVGIGTTNPTSKLEVQNGDIKVGVNTSQGLILTSPNGTKFRLIVDNSGVLSTVLVS